MTDGVRLSELVAALTQRGTPLASETALFIALECAEVLRSAPGPFSATDVFLQAEGGVVVVPDRSRSDEREAIHSIAAILEECLTLLPPPARGIVARARMGQVPSLSSLSAELEAQLVPLNRAAARRILGRLVRDFARGQDDQPDRTSAERQAETRTETQTEQGPPGDVDASALLARDTVTEDSQADAAWMPKIPPPPRLGSLASLVDHATRLASSRPSTPPDAADTVPDSPTSLPAVRDTPPAHRGKRVFWFVLALLAVGAMALLWYQGFVPPGTSH